MSWSSVLWYVICGTLITCAITCGILIALAAYGHQKRCECILKDFMNCDDVEKLWYEPLSITHRRIAFCGVCRVTAKWFLADYEKNITLTLATPSVELFPGKNDSGRPFSIFDEKHPNWYKFKALPPLRKALFVSPNFFVTVSNGRMSSSAPDLPGHGFADYQLMPNLLETCKSYFSRRPSSLEFVRVTESEDASILASIIARVCAEEHLFWDVGKIDTTRNRDIHSEYLYYRLVPDVDQPIANAPKYMNAIANQYYSTLALDRYLYELKNREIEWRLPLNLYLHAEAGTTIRICSEPCKEACLAEIELSVPSYVASPSTRRAKHAKSSEPDPDAFQILQILKKRNTNWFLVKACSNTATYVGWIEAKDEDFAGPGRHRVPEIQFDEVDILPFLRDTIDIPIILMVDV